MIERSKSTPNASLRVSPIGCSCSGVAGVPKTACFTRPSRSRFYQLQKSIWKIRAKRTYALWPNLSTRKIRSGKVRLRSERLLSQDEPIRKSLHDKRERVIRVDSRHITNFTSSVHPLRNARWNVVRLLRSPRGCVLPRDRIGDQRRAQGIFDHQNGRSTRGF